MQTDHVCDKGQVQARAQKEELYEFGSHRRLSEGDNALWFSAKGQTGATWVRMEAVEGGKSLLNKDAVACSLCSWKNSKQLGITESQVKDEGGLVVGGCVYLWLLSLMTISLYLV